MLQDIKVHVVWGRGGHLGRDQTFWGVWHLERWDMLLSGKVRIVWEDLNEWVRMWHLGRYQTFRKWESMRDRETWEI